MQSIERKLESKNWMIDVVSELLLPAIEKMGFEHVPSNNSKKCNREDFPTFPVGTFKRYGKDGLDLIEPHFFGRHKFCIDSAKIPLDGIKTEVRKIPAEDCLIAWGISWFELYQIRMLKLPFAVRFKIGSVPKREDYEKVVGKAISFLPEIEYALSTGNAGPHMRHVERITKGYGRIADVDRPEMKNPS